MQSTVQKEKSVSSKLLFTLIATLAMLGASTPAQGAPTGERPSLVVGIVVEGLNEDYLNELQNRFGPGGFKRLMGSSLIVDQIDYGTFLDPAAATAMIYSGAAPIVNGIPAAHTFDLRRQHARSILSDSTQLGNFTSQLLSPKPLLVSTLTDELKIDGNGASYAYSLAADPQQAIIMAGHAGNGGFWIDDVTGQWATSTYYGDPPQAVTQRNYMLPLSARLDTLMWRPSIAMGLYPNLPATRLPKAFNYVFPKNDKDRYRAFKVSARGNNEVTSLASEILHYQMLGQHSGVDMLSLAYTVAPYAYSETSDTRVETMDAYLRLDRDLEKLFKAIDSKPGADKTLVFVAALPARTASKPDDPQWKVPTGQFSSRKAKSLLNMYLMALHGNGEWVSGYHDRHFYLNHMLINQKKLSVGEIRQEAAEFLNRMSGVSNAFTIDDLLAARVGTNPQALRRNTSVSTAGDVIIDVNPGWEAVDDLTGGPTYLSRDSHTPTPLFIMGPGVAAERVSTPIDARQVAPTVARLLRIRSPNAASLPALRR